MVMPFEKGKVSNPKGGVVKEMRISTWIEKVLDETDEDLSTRLGYERALTKREILARKMVKVALDNDKEGTALDYIKEVLDRTEGKAKQTLDHNVNLAEKMAAIAERYRSAER